MVQSIFASISTIGLIESSAPASRVRSTEVSDSERSIDAFGVNFCSSPNVTDPSELQTTLDARRIGDRARIVRIAVVESGVAD